MPPESTVDSRPGVAFPGQVTQTYKITKALLEHRDHPLVELLLDRLAVYRPESIDLRDTRVAQPCTYVAGLANAQRVCGGEPGVPVALGHSLGEITALAFAGAIDPVAGLDLVFELGRVGHEQHRQRPSALVAVMNLDADTVEWLRRLAVAQVGGVLEVSGRNGPDQIVLCGEARPVVAVTALARQAGGLTAKLPIRGAYHCSLMTSVLGRWRTAVAALEWRPPRVPLLSTVDNRWRTGTEGVDELLARWLLLPVRWHEAMLALRRHGIHTLWEAGPGDVLRRLGRRSNVIEYAEPVRRPARAASLHPMERTGRRHCAGRSRGYCCGPRGTSGPNASGGPRWPGGWRWWRPARPAV